ncbi:DNA mismatch repair protein MutS [bacterium]|nr:DNA mismatch repair protein MutS [bacterium]MBU1637172.1 DNA mismatch repair protein MutS [bacterium]MBU1919262.1 DNA mismatch repair protein MutS [bacterium]
MPTPMLQQYREIKSQYPDVILFYRMGDFYEMFYEDAKLGAEVLGITLTKRNNGKESEVPLAGFPHHQLENYVAKMTRAGFRVAVCDQIEDPKKAKGIVKRAVTEVVSSGTTFSDKVLEENRNNYLAAVLVGEDQAGLAYADVTAQEFFTGILPLGELASRLSSLEPSEMLCTVDQRERILELLGKESAKRLTIVPQWHFTSEAATKTLTGHYGVANLKGFGLSGMDLAVGTAGALVSYLKANLVANENLLPDLQIFNNNQELILDPSTRRNLEIVESLSDHPQSTLISILDRTRTAAGARLLRRWVIAPLTDLERIRNRQSKVEFLVSEASLNATLSDVLKGSGDMQRLLAKLTTHRGLPRDAIALRYVLERLPQIQKLFSRFNGCALDDLLARLQPQAALVEHLKQALVEEPPATLADGGYIRRGYSAELDELRGIGTNARGWIQQHQIAERDRTGIPSLKIGYNKVFGYYIEITNTHKDKIPDDYIRKQTLTNAERYVTPDLKEWEEKILTANEKITELEQELWNQVRSEIVSQAEVLTAVARALAELDVFHSLALVARENNYVKPELNLGKVISLIDGRHPVVESLLPAGKGFVPNDLTIGTDDFQIMILTGPNMAGKSTYLRQVALIVILAQMGSFIPAKAATIGLVDRIFTRIGAGDNVAGGESTFLVEMTEVSNILRNATERSLVILDEVGRGTSTYDGLSLAWAITEYLHENPQVAAKTLFATHYHELNRMASEYSRIANSRIEVEEWGDRVVFLHKITRGETDRSYGVEVARLAGLPPSVVERARALLPTWERPHEGEKDTQVPRVFSPKLQLTLFESDTQKVADALLELDLERLTPRQALDKLFEIKELLDKRKRASDSKKS